MIKSQSIKLKDFSSKWYRRWSILLKQEKGVYGRKIHNKAWQNAIILQALSERGYLKAGNAAIGFGVGTERIPSALAALGLRVTATDQSLETGRKAGWDNIGQLTHDRNDLNQYGIAKKNDFDSNVIFRNCDMRKINNEFQDYDIVWSNCALGHLGSIEAGLQFIEASLAVLKPGGIAVHTTEINIVSDTKTLDSGDTVIFRRRDIVGLFQRLRRKGYTCAPLVLDYGSLLADAHFSGHPYDDEPLLKLNVGGHLLSQIVLIIKKPKTPKINRTSAVKARIENRLNRLLASRYLRTHPEVSDYLTHQKPNFPQSIKAKKRTVSVSLKPGQIKSISLSFQNASENHYYGTFQAMHDTYPLVIATANPINRMSKAKTATWPSPSRPTLEFSTPAKTSLLEGIAPNRDFCARIEIKAPKETGEYREDFCFVLEGSDVIPNSNFTVIINVK